MKLRPYQSEACRRIIEEFDKGIDRTLLVLPTGCGKTIVFNGVAFRFAYNADKTPSGGRVLILAHQNILIDQAAGKFRSVMGIETDRIQGKHPLLGLPVSVSSVQTMQRRLTRYKPDEFSLIIIDEAHHSMSRGYQMVINHFTGAKLLGVTATPDRADKQKLESFESVAYQYTIEEAINDGYLSPINVIRPRLNIDLSEVRKSHGDLLESDIGNVLEPHLHKIAVSVREKAKGRRTVCFVPLIRTAKKAAEIFSHYGFTAAWTSGADPDRAEKLEDFAAGKYDIIFNSMLLTEGWDCPETDCVIVLRPTTSRSLYVQMIGRGLRLAEGKKDCLLIDFLFQNSKFDLASPENVLGANFKREPDEDSKEEETEEAEKAEGTGKGSDVEERLAAMLEGLATSKDPHFNPKWRAIVESVPHSDLFESGPTKYQAEKLKTMGIDPKTVTYAEAAALIHHQYETKEPSNAQKWRLRKLGFSSDEIANMNFSIARKELAKAKALGRW